MERSAGTVSAIKALGYPGSRCLSRCRCDELPCPLLSWLCAELRTLCPELRDSGGSGDVLLAGELKNVLSNISSPLAVLTSEVLDPSTLNKVAEFLVSELQAARIIKYKESHPDERATEADSEKEQRVQDLSRDFCEENEGDDGSGENRRKAEMQAEWILLLRALNMDASSRFEDVLNEVNERLSRLPSGDMTKPLLSTSLSSEQWLQVKKMNEILSEDYRRRRQMMVTRFQVTLESFAWGEKQKERSAALASAPNLASLIGSSQVSPSLLLAAREDQSFIDPVKAGTSTSVYKTLMGSVPDRGGRPGEIEPPMPAWTGRSSKGNRGGRGGGQSHKHKKKKGKKD
ncbi:protein FAM98B isoform X1 [Pelmatolapia mariae]|uniref:protein FAM98B isoform X1 n=1 Tax=Pelmatolapia mariae TaxID=158779 RepID=UPI002FE5456D